MRELKLKANKEKIEKNIRECIEKKVVVK